MFLLQNARFSKRCFLVVFTRTSPTNFSQSSVTTEIKAIDAILSFSAAYQGVSNFWVDGDDALHLNTPKG